MIQGSLLMLWMNENASQQSNEKLLMKKLTIAWGNNNQTG